MTTIHNDFELSATVTVERVGKSDTHQHHTCANEQDPLIRVSLRGCPSQRLFWVSVAGIAPVSPRVVYSKSEAGLNNFHRRKSPRLKVHSR